MHDAPCSELSCEDESRYATATDSTGEVYDDPSEDALLMFMEDLERAAVAQPIPPQACELRRRKPLVEPAAIGLSQVQAA
jgi:hypothetical protein